MVENRYAFEDAPKTLKGAVLVVNPTRLDDLYKVAAVSLRFQQFLGRVGVVPLTVKVPAKKLIYVGKSVISEGFVSVRLPHSVEEQRYMQSLRHAEIWEISREEHEGIVQVEGDRLVVIRHSPELPALQELWKSLPEKSKIFGFFNAPPFFQNDVLSVFWHSKREAIARIMQRLQVRYEEKRMVEKVPSTLVVTATREHFHRLFYENDHQLSQAYAKAMLQIPEDPIIFRKFARQMVGYSISEQVTGLDIFMQVINAIGREGLPYTIYLVGGFGNIAYQARDYFINIYPNLRENFVGISMPPSDFLDKEEIVSVVAQDIGEKKPDIVFVGMALSTQEGFLVELLRRNINFGIGVGIGNTFEILTSHRKKQAVGLRSLWDSYLFILKQFLGK